MPGPRVLWLTQSHPPSRGGMAQSSDRLVRHLRRRGLALDVAHLSPRHTREQTEARQGGRDVIVPAQGDPAHALHLLLHAVRRADIEPDVVVAFGGVQPLQAGPLYASLLEAELVTLLRGNDLDTALFSPTRSQSLIRALERSARVAVLSTDHERKVRALVPGAPVRVLANGLDLDWAQPSPSEVERARGLRPDDGRLFIGLVGHLKAKKGARFFLDCVRTSPVVDQLAVHLVGEVAPELESLLAEPPPGLVLTHQPFCDHDELLAVYPAFDAVALPSFYDGMPNVMLEALALGRPLISSTAGAMGDHVLDGRHGFVFAPGDAHGCREALARLVAAGDEGRAEISCHAKALAAEFSADREADRLHTLLTEVAA